MDEFEALELEDLGEFEDLEELEDWELEDLEDVGEFEDEEDFEDWELEGLGAFEDWELEDLEDLGEFEDLGELEGLIYETPTRRRRRPRRRRPRRAPTITMPPMTVTVHPRMILDNFCFREASGVVRHLEMLKKLARSLVRSRRRTTVRLVGHTDNIGKRSDNDTLGMQRAQWVAKYLGIYIRRLNPRAIRRIRIVPQTAGERRPRAKNSTRAGQAKNRRVEVFIQ